MVVSCRIALIRGLSCRPAGHYDWTTVGTIFQSLARIKPQSRLLFLRSVA